MPDAADRTNFAKLWIGQTVSQIGSQVSLVALPLVAVLSLDSSPLAVAVLGAMETLPFLLFALPAGVWVDRLRRRPLMIGADFGRLVSLLSIPVAQALGSLGMPQLMIVGFVNGTLTVFFDVSYLSYVPSLVGRKRIVSSNARLESTRTAASTIGPALGGALVSAVGAPLAMIADAVSFGISGVLITSIRRREPPPAQDGPRRPLRTDLREGLSYVARQPYLRALALATAASTVFQLMVSVLLIVYLVRSLDLSPATIGVVFVVSNVGALAGALLSGRVAARFGLGRTIAWSAVLSGAAWVTVPLAPSSGPLPVLFVGAFFGPFGGLLFNVNQLNLRQSITPERLLGRMNSVMRFMFWGSRPLGMIAGGLLSTWLGLRTTLYVGAVGGTVAMLPLTRLSLVRLVAVPDEPLEPVVSAAPAGTEAARRPRGLLGRRAASP